MEFAKLNEKPKSYPSRPKNDDPAGSEKHDPITRSTHLVGLTFLCEQMLNQHGSRKANSGLSKREREVLVWAANGKSAWETSRLLGLTESTVKSYIANACRKLGAQNKVHAVALAITHGLL